jgi:hypothetical protein
VSFDRKEAVLFWFPTKHLIKATYFLNMISGCQRKGIQLFKTETCILIQGGAGQGEQISQCRGQEAVGIVKGHSQSISTDPLRRLGDFALGLFPLRACPCPFRVEHPPPQWSLSAAIFKLSLCLLILLSCIRTERKETCFMLVNFCLCDKDKDAGVNCWNCLNWLFQVWELQLVDKNKVKSSNSKNIQIFSCS